MGKRVVSKLSFVASLLLVFQLAVPVVSTYAATTPASTAGTGSLLPPGNLASTFVTPDDVKLSWTAVYGATGYNVYAIQEGSLELLGKVTTTSFQLNNLAEGSYQYVVSTLSSDGESGPCAPLDVQVSYPQMAAPATLSKTIQNGNDIALSWGASQYAETYNVYQIGADGSKTLINSVAGKTSYTVTNVAAGSYTYAISAVNSLYGESPLSTTVSADVTFPTMAAPGNFTFTMSNGNDVNLRWNGVTYATAYKLYQMIDGQKVFKQTLTGTSVTLTNQAAGDYLYEIHSYSDRFGESTDGSQRAVTVGDIAMAAPANFAYKLQNVNDVVLTWTAAANATGYKVYQIVDGQPVLQSTVTGTTVTFKNQPAGDYAYQVTSYNDRFGESDPSQVSFTLNATTMAAPSNFVAKLQNVNDIALSWASVPNATAYKVYQIVDGQKVLKSTVTSLAVTYTNQAAGDYTFEVHSYSDKFGESTDGSQASLTIGATTMAAPDNATSQVQNGNDIVLNWSAAANANYYKVYQIVNGQKVLKSSPAGTSVTFSNQAAGDYTYEIHSYSTRFGESADGATVTLTLAWPTMAPPANVTQTNKNATDFTLSWDAANYATSYKVYQIVNGQKVLKSTVTTTSVTYTGMTPGDYTYEVHAVSSRFGESTDGTQVTFTLNGQVMGAPANLSYTISNGNDIALKWDAVTYATSYKIYTVIGGQKVLQKTVTTTSATLTNQPGGDTDIIVDSVSSVLGESPTGAEIQFTLTLPTMAAPTTLTSKVQNGSDVALNWTAVTYADHYNVYELVGGQETLLKTVTGLSAVLSNVAAGDHIYVVHSSSTRFGESPTGAQATQTVDQQMMTAPGNFTQTIVNGNDISLKWNAVTYATAYKVYQIVDGQKVLKNTVTATSVSYSNQPAGDYTYEVHSYSDRYGESADGSQVSFTLTWPTMQAPSGNLTQTISNGNDITLRWGTSTYATGYKVYQIVDGQKVLKTTTGGTAVAYTNQPAGDYTYEVHSYSTRFGESPEGSTVSFTLVWPTVAPPVVKDTVQNANNLTLNWNSVQWANEYRVYEVTGDTRTQLYKGTGLSFQIFNLTEATHTYVVTAYSTRFGESQASNVVQENIIYPVMQAPTATLKLTGPASAQISWSFVTYANGYNVYEIVDGKPVPVVQNLNNLSYTVSNLPYADHQYYVTSVSNSFGESAPSNTVLAKLIVDTTPPVTTANSPTDWTNQNAVVTLSATDADTSVAHTYYSLNDSAFVEGTSIPVTTEGVNKISFYSVDKVGNTEATKTINVKVDKTAPVTKANDVPAWFNQSATINLTATDAQSGVAKTYYSINGSDYVEGTTVTVDGADVNTVSYYSVDQAGNKEQPQTITLNSDRTAPVTTSDAPTTWSNEPVTVKLTATDAQSGVAKTYYSINGSDYVEGTSVKVDVDGENKISYYSVDAVGNQEQAQTVMVQIDRSAPTTTSDAPTTWSSQDVTVNLTSTDAGSGVAKTYYSINGADFVEGTSLKVDQEGTNQVAFYSVDTLGNKEQTQTVTVKIDRTAPTTSNTSSLDAASDWTNDSVAITLHATDAASGVAHTYYSINGGAYVEGTSFTVDQEGVNTVSYYSVDAAGNKEQAQTVTVKIDRTAPTTTSDAPATWSSQDVTVNLTSTDAGSGVAKTYYSINGADFVEGTSLKVDQEGTNQVAFYSVDALGNKEQTQTVTVKIDRTAPTTTSSTQSLAPSDWTKDSVAISLRATDAASGVAHTYYSINGGEYVEGTSFTVDQEGVNTVSYYSVDAVGNKEAAQTMTVKIDRTAPVTTSNAPTDWTTQDVTVNFTSSDQLSGVAHTYYSIDGADYVEGTSLTLTTEGDHKVSFYSTDGAGNSETPQTVEVKIDKSAPTATMDLGNEIKMGTTVPLNYLAQDDLSGIASDKMTVNMTGPLFKNSKVVTNGTAMKFDNPGNYTITITVTNAAGLTTTIQKQVVVYIPVNVDVTAKVINKNKGELTVRVELPWGYSPIGFDLNTVTLNGAKAENSNNGYFNQAKNGQFKFDRSDIDWDKINNTTVVLRGYVFGYLVIGTGTVKVIK